MGVEVAEEGELLVRRRRWPRLLALLAALLALALLALWLVRKPIARGQADRVLARAGVPARYTISDLGFGRQRLTNVSIGDPAAPDLVADWLETRTAWGLRGPYLAGVRGGRVRVRARWADGRLSLGSLDRLLPKGQGGKPFALPALALDVADLRARVDTPWGALAATLAGKGRLDGGFDGRLALAADRLAGAGCTATTLRLAARVRVERSGPLLAGPLRTDAVTCGQNSARGIAAHLALGLDRALTAWRADAARLAIDRVAFAGQSIQNLTGSIGAQPMPLTRLPTGVRGHLDLHSGAFDMGEVAGQAARLAGRFYYSPTDVQGRPARMVVTSAPGDGGPPGMRLSLTGARLPPARLAAVAQLGTAGQGTPLAPLTAQLGRALEMAGQRFDLDADVQPEVGDWEQGLTLHRLALTAATGARMTLAPGSRLTYYRTQRFSSYWQRGRGWRRREYGPGSGVDVNGTLALAGGGLPDATVRLSQPATNLPVTAAIAMRPYAVDGASLALADTQVRWTPGANSVRLVTRATLSGPLGDGRVEALTLPLDARLNDGALTLAGGCTPVTWQAVATAGLRLDPAAVRLCSRNVGYRNGHVGGALQIAATRLTGRLGTTPLTLATAGAQLRLADRGFTLAQVDARLGQPGRESRLTIGRLDGQGVAGRFADAGGRIGAVPLAMSGAAGDWRLANGVLDLDGALTVADTAAPARFQPMAARGVTLRLADGRITAAGLLHEPTTGTRVAAVAIRHDLAAGRGSADLTVTDLAFAKGFQPDLLTKVTYGVVADVRGTVSGEGHLAWDAAGVTSTGAFRTEGTDLAAAFGPVTGLAGEIRFTDLLALESAPGQRVTVKSINPGVPVTDGVVTFRTLPGTRIQVEGARWPFAGGALTLDPTLLDFSGTAERRMTFHVIGAAADKFLQSFDFKNLNATGIFDGVLPMAFDTSGGRIENGRLQVREGGGTIAYVGDIGRKNLGFWGNFAFDALKSLRYRLLALTMNGPIAGEMVTEVRFAGVTQGEGAKTNFIIRRLQRLPVLFNIRIRAPFRGLLDATAGFYDPRRLIERNLPELIERQNRGVQPPASETVP